MATSNILLEDCFSVLGKNRQFDVKLTPSYLYYSNTQLNKGEGQAKRNCLSLDDVVGCRSDSRTCNKKSGSSKKLNSAASFTIFAYPFKKHIIGSGKSRRRIELNFCVDKSENSEDNLCVAKKWSSAICTLIRGEEIRPGQEINSTIVPRSRRMLVLINPNSGPGKAFTLFKDKLLPFLVEADIQYNAILTEKQGHATEIVKDMNLTEWDAIVIVSGDGLVNEVINGLMNREDSEEAIKMPIGIVPAGSGNALCCSLLYSVGVPLDSKSMMLNAAFMLAKGGPAAMDLIQVETPQKTLYAFLSVDWGLFADVDIESEKYRSIGNARFTLGSLLAIKNKKTYRGKLSYLSLPAGDHLPGGAQQSAASQPDPPLTGPPLPALSDPVPSHWTVVEGEFVNLVGVFLTHLGPELFLWPEGGMRRRAISLQYILAPISRKNLTVTLLQMEDASFLKAGHVQVELVQAFRLEPATPDAHMAIDGEDMECQTLQAQLAPSCCNVIATRGKV